MVRIPTKRQATHPGEILLEDFLRPMGITQTQLAEAIKVPFQRVNEIVSGKRGLTPSTTLRLARYFGNSPGFWLNLQCDATSKRPKKKRSPGPPQYKTRSRTRCLRLNGWRICAAGRVYYFHREKPHDLTRATQGFSLPFTVELDVDRLPADKVDKADEDGKGYYLNCSWC